MPSTLLGSAPTSALFFIIYDNVKAKLEQNSNLNNPIYNQIIAANLGEISACLIRVPVDVVKQKSQSQLSISTLNVFKNILRTEVSCLKKLLNLIIKSKKFNEKIDFFYYRRILIREPFYDMYNKLKKLLQETLVRSLKT